METHSFISVEYNAFILHAECDNITGDLCKILKPRLAHHTCTLQLHEDVGVACKVTSANGDVAAKNGVVSEK